MRTRPRRRTVGAAVARSADLASGEPEPTEIVHLAVAPVDRGRGYGGGWSRPSSPGPARAARRHREDHAHHGRADRDAVDRMNLQMRIARPTDQPERLVAFYRDGVGPPEVDRVVLVADHWPG